MSTGQLQSLQQSASQYAGMVTAFCDKLRRVSLSTRLSPTLTVQRACVKLERAVRKIKKLGRSPCSTRKGSRMCSWKVAF